MPTSWNDLTSWQRKRAVEGFVMLVAAWYTTYNLLPDIPYGPVRLELLTDLLVLAVASWWLVLALIAVGRQLAGKARRA